MAFLPLAKLVFSKLFTNTTAFPVGAHNVRQELQDLHNETANYLNNTVTPTIDDCANAKKGPKFTWSGTINANTDVTITHSLGYKPVVQMYGTVGNITLTFTHTDVNNVRVSNYNANANAWVGTVDCY